MKCYKIFGCLSVLLSLGALSFGMIKRTSSIIKVNPTAVSLFKAIRDGKVMTVRSLVAHKAPVNAQTEGGFTALQYAICSTHPEKTIVEIVTELLKSKDIDLDRSDKAGWTALHYAARKGLVPVVALLVASGARVTVQTIVHELTPFHCVLRAYTQKAMTNEKAAHSIIQALRKAGDIDLTITDIYRISIADVIERVSSIFEASQSRNIEESIDQAFGTQDGASCPTCVLL